MQCERLPTFLKKLFAASFISKISAEQGFLLHNPLRTDLWNMGGGQGPPPNPPMWDTFEFAPVTDGGEGIEAATSCI